MAAVFGSVLLPHRQRNGIHAQAGIDIRRVGLDVVDLQAEGAHGGDKALQILAVFQLKVYLKVVGTVFEVDFKRREQRQTAHQRRIADDGDRIQPRADGQADHAAGPERHRGRQPLDLVFGAVKNRVAADDGDGDHRRGGNQRPARALDALIQQHGHGRGQRNEDKRPLSRRVALACALAADHGGKDDGNRHPQQDGIQVEFGCPAPQQRCNRVVHVHGWMPPVERPPLKRRL